MYPLRKCVIFYSLNTTMCVLCEQYHYETVEIPIDYKYQNRDHVIVNICVLLELTIWIACRAGTKVTTLLS